MRKRLYAVIVGLAVATVVYFAVAIFTTWTVIHSGRSESAVRSYFMKVTIASVAIGLLAGWWWHRWLRRRAARTPTRH
jgi:Kef-type K+ transport system membrane component KefB